ncbi:MAG: hypothetical protein IIZ39_07715, partial [Blautia sp.]|nr:hypothetical protein [Blautia sp.]
MNKDTAITWGERGEISEGMLMTGHVKFSIDDAAFDQKYEVFLITNLSGKAISYEAHVLDLPFKEGRIGGLLRRQDKGCYCIMERSREGDNQSYLASLCRQVEKEDEVMYGLQPVKPMDIPKEYLLQLTMNAAPYFMMGNSLYANATGRLYRLVRDVKRGMEAVSLELIAYSREFSPAGSGPQYFVRGDVVTFTQVPK